MRIYVGDDGKRMVCFLASEIKNVQARRPDADSEADTGWVTVTMADGQTFTVFKSQDAVEIERVFMELVTEWKGATG